MEGNHQINESRSVRNEDTLRELYHGKKMTMQEVADELNTTKHKVRYWMDKHGIGRRSNKEAKLISGGPPKLKTDHQGYETFRFSEGGENRVIQHHRLLAVCEYELGEIKDKHIHHINGIPWFNTVENLEPLEERKHFKEHGDATPIHEQYAMWAMHETGEYTYKEIGELLDENPSNVGTFISWVRNGKYQDQVIA